MFSSVETFIEFIATRLFAKMDEFLINLADHRANESVFAVERADRTVPEHSTIILEGKVWLARSFSVPVAVTGRWKSSDTIMASSKLSIFRSVYHHR